MVLTQLNNTGTLRELLLFSEVLIWIWSSFMYSVLWKRGFSINNSLNRTKSKIRTSQGVLVGCHTKFVYNRPMFWLFNLNEKVNLCTVWFLEYHWFLDVLFYQTKITFEQCRGFLVILT